MDGDRPMSDKDLVWRIANCSSGELVAASNVMADMLKHPRAHSAEDMVRNVLIAALRDDGWHAEIISGWRMPPVTKDTSIIVTLSGDSETPTIHCDVPGRWEGQAECGCPTFVSPSGVVLMTTHMLRCVENVWTPNR